MCSVSVVHDYMRQNVPLEWWTRPQFDEYKEIIDRLDKLDKNLNQPDCDDAEKSRWMQEVELRLQRLENGS